MKALIDADIVCYRVGFTTEEESEAIAKYRCDDLMDKILLETESNEYQAFLSDSKENNFRYQIDPQYKANRVAPKPKHLDFLKEHLIVNWGAKIAHGMEADDALGIAQDKSRIIGDTTICSIDKDLLQIPGNHYNFVKSIWTIVGVEDGLLSFYRSILVGDVADNIKGVYGIGPKKAEKILPKWIDEETAIREIRKYYEVWFEKEGNTSSVDQMILKNGRLLKIKQQENEGLWSSQYLKLTEEQQKLSSILPQEEELNLYMERITLDNLSLGGSPVAGQ